MRFKKIFLFSIIAVLAIVSFSCKAPWEEDNGDDGPMGPGGGYYGDGGGTYGSGGYGCMGINIISDRFNVGFGESVNIRAEVNGGNPPYTYEWYSSEGYFSSTNGNAVVWNAPPDDSRQWTDVMISLKVRDTTGHDDPGECFIKVEKIGYNGGGYNGPPMFDGDVWTDTDNIKINERVRLFVNAHDPDGDLVNFEWTCRSGEGRFENAVNNPNHSEIDWVASVPQSGNKSFEIVCRIYDNNGNSNEMSRWVNIESSNSPPYIARVEISPVGPVGAGATINLNAYASDPDNDPLTFSWDQMSPYMNGVQLALGTFLPGPSGANVSWQAPVIPKSSVYNAYSVWYDIRVKVNDPNNNFNDFMVRVEVLTDPNQ